MFRNVVVPLDGSNLAECVLPYVHYLAGAFASRVTLVRVVEPQSSERTDPIDPLQWEIRKSEACAYLDQVAARLEEANIEVTKELLEGRPAERITDFAHREQADFIVLSSHGQTGPSSWNVSTVVHNVIRNAATSILIVRATREGQSDLDLPHIERLLVPLDGSQRAEAVLGPAETLIRHFQGRMILAHVVQMPEMPHRAPLTDEEIGLRDRLIMRNKREAEHYLEVLSNRFADFAETRLLIGDSVVSSLHEIEEREDVDLVLLAAHGYASSRQSRLFGSVATSFLINGTRSLLIVQDLTPEETPLSALQTVGERQGH